VASYHLEKLRDLDLVKKDRGDYELKKTVSFEVMKSFVRVSHLMIPRYVFYTVFFLTLLNVFIVGYVGSLSLQGVFALVFGVSGLVITGYETWRQWRARVHAHRNIQNTMKYIDLEHAIFNSRNDDHFTVKVAETVEEACELVEAGFEYVTEVNHMQIFRKRK